MDTLEWGRHSDYDDFEFVEDEPMYTDSHSSFYDDFTASFQPVFLQQTEPSFINDSITNFFGTPLQIKQEPLYQESTTLFVQPSQIQPQYQFQPTPVVKQETKVKTNSHKRQLCEVSEEPSREFDIRIETQPPVEVRTRTPSEIRTFSVSARVTGKYRSHDASIMKVQLCYAATSNFTAEPVKKDILGGTKTVALLADGSAIFDNLWISESSTKHKEREFCLEFILLSSDGTELLRKSTKAFYAYSHKKVLQRRGNVKLRTLSKSYGRISGGEQMHVIGTPFIQGPALSLLFRTPHGEVSVKNLEFYSDSVLFFELPAYPLPEGAVVTPDLEIKVNVLLTNDGRTYSNVLDFTYLADNTPRSRI